MKRKIQSIRTLSVVVNRRLKKRSFKKLRQKREKERKNRIVTLASYISH